MSLQLIGLGQAMRGDDGVGPLVVSLVRSKAKLSCRHCETPLALMSAPWSSDDEVVIVDAACEPKLSLGSILIFRGDGNLNLPRRSQTSSHGLDLVTAIELLRMLGRMPRALAIVAVAGCNFAPLAAMTDAVKQAAEDLAQRFADGWSPWEAMPVAVKPPYTLEWEPRHA